MLKDTAFMVDQQSDSPLADGSPVAHDVLQIATQANEYDSKSSIDSAIDLDIHSNKPNEDNEDISPTKRILAARPRADSAQVDVSTASRDSQSKLTSPTSILKIKTSGSSLETSSISHERDSISASPTLSKHVIPSPDVRGQSLAPIESPTPSTSSPKAERLPSIHQITSSLTELAEAATQELPRQQQVSSHHHSNSFGSAMSQSPILPSHTYPTSTHTSPQAYYPQTIVAHSPKNIGENYYASPPAYPSYGAYSHRRASTVDGVPPIMPKLPTTSSSGDSYSGYPSSGTEGYSTNHTTPVDTSQTADNTPRPMLPPPPGMNAYPLPPPAIMIPGPYKCDVPNCTAGTFQTQYLLNSHKNVHSQSRPHYCPVAGCSRSEGGKGFKRKNEMIRHGLVHNSPGYVCPFCPEREHRYPRPDNLQRHVRVHHVDKDRDDDVLRDVLNQRTEGQGKTRRRRTNTGPMIAAI